MPGKLDMEISKATSETKKPGELVVVLGMHRSGTSALTKGLECLGVDLGKNLMPPGPDNPKGYYEDLEFHRLNDEMLQAAGHRWNHVGALAAGRLETMDGGSFFRRAAELVSARAGAGSPRGLKDPRACLLLPFWKRVFDAAGVRARYVVVFRHPASVAASLMRRDGASEVRCAYLWVTYNAAILAEVGAEESLAVDYDDLLREPGNQIGRLARFLELPVDAGRLREYASRFIDPGLNHAGGEGRPVAGGCFAPALALHAVLRGRTGPGPASADTAVPGAKAWCESLLGYQNLVLAHLEADQKTQAERVRLMDEMEARLDSLAAENARLAGRIGRIESSAGWRAWRWFSRLGFETSKRVRDA